MPNVTNDHLKAVTEAIKASTPQHVAKTAHIKTLAASFGAINKAEAKQTKSVDNFGVDKEEFKNDVLALKKQGYPIERVHNVIDHTPEITDKSAAKQAAVEIYNPKGATIK